MEHLQQLIFLIDAASKIAGSDSKLAAAIGQHRSKVSDWRKGRQACPPEMQALMAHMAGFDAQKIALRALVEKHEGSELGDKLMRALGKPSRVTGAVAGFVGAAVLAIFGLIIPTRTDAHALTPQLDNRYYVKSQRRESRRRWHASPQLSARLPCSLSLEGGAPPAAGCRRRC